ncbi:MAG: carboxypeptidase regulatory-like domain-containing protein [Acidobacteria bacterium]|nr:carboxypeptidase regulatory-like domain-containing protein [Acidobacteriota bacterium]
MKTAISFAIALTLLSVSVLSAQTPRLTGTVLDPSGAVIPDVDVRVLQGTAVVREGKTNDTGNFTFDLPAGEYRLEVTADAFRPHQQNVRVTANMRPLRIPLAVAGVNAVVDVGQRDDRVGLEEDANLTSTVISGDRIKDLPEDEDALMAQLQALAGGTGAAGSTATFVVDGFSNGRVPPRDQIQQIIIDTNVFSAESIGGARIQIITRPGTGPWSGNVNVNFNDESLNARGPYDRNKPSKSQRQFITSYGGPVIPGKLTMRFNARTLQIEQEGLSVLAVTPEGPVNVGVFSPIRNQNLNLNGQLFLTQNNTFNFGANYTTNEQRNQGIGGFTLPERATNSKGHNWNFNLGERAIINQKLISEARFNLSRNTNSQAPVTEGIAINVLDAFNRGGAQNRSRRRGTTSSFGNTLRWTARPKLNIQMGTDFYYNNNYSSAETNYLGVFVFSSIEDYLAERPITFRRMTGDPVMSVAQLEFVTFFQADWRVNPKLNIGAGARYQAQTNLGDSNNLAPTFQAAYQPRTGTVIRAGGRLSYQTFNIGNTEQIRRQDGLNHQVETVILNPSYPDPFLNGSGTTSGTSNGSIRTRDPYLRAPYTINSAVTLEQSLIKGWRFSTSVDVTRGVHLIRTRNINAPYPGAPLPADLFDRLNSRLAFVQAAARNEVDRMRPLYPNAGNIYQFESAARSLSKNLGVRLFTPANFAIHGIGITGLVQYTLGWAHDDQNAVNQYDWSEWARSSADTRRRFLGNATLRLPRASTISMFITANSGRPYSMTTGKDENGDQATNDRPAGVARNSLIGPGNYNVQMSFTKQFSLRKPEPQRPGAAAANPAAAAGVQQVIIAGPGGPAIIVTPAPAPGAAQGPRMSFNVNVNNLLNNTQVRGYSGVLTSPLFGKPTGAGPGRTINLGLGLIF